MPTGVPAALRDCQNLPAFASINLLLTLAFLHDEHRIKYTLPQVRLNVERNATHRCGCGTLLLAGSPCRVDPRATHLLTEQRARLASEPHARPHRRCHSHSTPPRPPPQPWPRGVGTAGDVEEVAVRRFRLGEGPRHGLVALLEEGALGCAQRHREDAERQGNVREEERHGGRRSVCRTFHGEAAN